jgi:hypothetical protein
MVIMSLFFKAINEGYKLEDLKTHDGYDKHIYCWGSREHVLSYNSNGVRCSNVNCIVNVNNQVASRNEVIFLNEVK